MNGAGPSAPEPGDSRVVTTGGTMGSRALGSNIERHEVHGATHGCGSGTPMTVSKNKEYKTLFGARSVTGLALYEHRHDHQHLPDGSVQIKNRTINYQYSHDEKDQTHIY